MTQLLQHIPNSNEKLDTALLFDQAKISRPTSKTVKHYKADYNNPAPMFAEHVNVDDIRKLDSGLKTVGTCDYLQGLLASKICKPFEYQEFLEELPSKKHSMMQTYL